MYESRYQHPLTHPHFVRRVLVHMAIAFAIISFSLAAGIAGYEHYEQLVWRDAFLDSAMLLGGMGPVHPPHTNGGKVFAGVYALYAGLIFLISVAIVLAPAVHRLLHIFHWEGNQRSK